jgi:hypothetical protein
MDGVDHSKGPQTPKPVDIHTSTAASSVAAGEPEAGKPPRQPALVSGQGEDVHDGTACWLRHRAERGRPRPVSAWTATLRFLATASDYEEVCHA